MRASGSNVRKSYDCRKQHERAKISSDWLHDFPLRQERRKAPYRWVSPAGENYTEAAVDC